jgi:CubicO group peptidase (beta-lactamase class C family)
VNERDLTELLGRHASRHSVPGAAVGILHEGSVAIACHGIADARTGDPVSKQTRFAVGSLTKSMVATAIARLAQSGALSLDDPAARHVPELHASAWAERATVRDLLANRSGLPLRAAWEFGFDTRPEDDDRALARLVADAAAAPSRNPASDLWSYSNVGWCVLGRVVEAAAGVTWEEAMRDNLADPAGMEGTAFRAGPLPNLAAGHEITDDVPVPVDPLAARAYAPAGASVVSTVTDLLRFAALHLEDPSLAFLRTVHADISIHGWLDSWCLGWAWFDWLGGPVWGWDGLTNGQRSVLRIVPEHQAAIVLLTNCGTGRAMYRPLLAKLMSPLGIGVPPLNLQSRPGAGGDLSRFVGTYSWPDRRIDVTATTDGLLIDSGNGPTVAKPLDGRTFLVDAADPDTPAVAFGAPDASGRPRVLYDMLWGLPRQDL